MSYTLNTQPRSQILTLNNNWNLVSFNVFITPSVFNDLSTNSNILQILDSSNNSVSSIDPFSGYWIDCSTSSPPVSIEINGPIFTQIDYTINPGWNLISYPTAYDISVTEFLTNFTQSSEITQIKNSTEAYISDLSDTSYLNSLTTLKPGNAYWIYSNSSTDISLNSLTTLKSEQELWAQLGNSVIISEDNQISEIRIALNQLGNIIATSLNNTCTIFEWTNNTAWVQKGNNIDISFHDDANYNAPINSINLNTLGNIISITVGGELRGVAGYQHTTSTLTRVFEFATTDWQPLGQDLLTEAHYQNQYNSVSLNADGTRIALTPGSPWTSWANPTTPYIDVAARVFELNNNDWQSFGEDISNDPAPWALPWVSSLCLNTDGTRIAISVPMEFWGVPGVNFATDYRGRTRIYEYTDSDWIQMGQTIYGSYSHEQLGAGVSLNANGDIVAISAAQLAGLAIGPRGIKIFKWENPSWTQIGDQINIQSPGDLMYDPISVCLNISGNIVTQKSSTNSSANIFEWNDTTWVQRNLPIETNNNTPSLISLNGDGDRIAFAYYDQNTNSTNCYIYQYDT